MKLPLATGLLSAAILAGCSPAAGSSSGHYVLRVDRTFDPNANRDLATEELSADNYRERAPTDRWNIAIEGSHVVLTAIDGQSAPVSRLEGREQSSVGGERRFELGNGGLENGRFVVRGDEAELTLFGSGVPVIMSERGKLLTAR